MKKLLIAGFLIASGCGAYIHAADDYQFEISSLIDRGDYAGFVDYYNANLSNPAKSELVQLVAMNQSLDPQDKIRFMEFLINKGADVNLPVDNTPLMIAAQYAGYPEIVDFLLQRKADTTLKNAEGKTAFDIAQDDHQMAIKRLEEYKAAGDEDTSDIVAAIRRLEQIIKLLAPKAPAAPLAPMPQRAGAGSNMPAQTSSSSTVGE